MKKKQSMAENYLDRKPVRNETLRWTVEDGNVTLEIDNKGVWNRMAQLIFRKPKISYVHLDETGSFIWPLLNGEQTILDIGKQVEEKFGDAAKPLYERLVQYVRILESYHFINWREE